MRLCEKGYVELVLKFSRILGLAILPLACLVFIGRDGFSLRKAVVLLCTFSFQTNAMATIYLVSYSQYHKVYSLFQALSTVYLNFVFIVWSTKLGAGKIARRSGFLISFYITQCRY